VAVAAVGRRLKQLLDQLGKGDEVAAIAAVDRISRSWSSMSWRDGSEGLVILVLLILVLLVFFFTLLVVDREIGWVGQIAFLVGGPLAEVFIPPPARAARFLPGSGTVRRSAGSWPGPQCDSGGRDGRCGRTPVSAAIEN